MHPHVGDDIFPVVDRGVVVALACHTVRVATRHGDERLVEVDGLGDEVGPHVLLEDMWTWSAGDTLGFPGATLADTRTHRVAVAVVAFGVGVGETVAVGAW